MCVFAYALYIYIYIYIYVLRFVCIENMSVPPLARITLSTPIGPGNGWYCAMGPGPVCVPMVLTILKCFGQ